jgi:hypothetical protein
VAWCPTERIFNVLYQIESGRLVTSLVDLAEEAGAIDPEDIRRGIERLVGLGEVELTADAKTIPVGERFELIDKPIPIVPNH